MNLLKLVTVFNWIIIAILAFLVIAETVSPTKGGDAAGRGMGQAIYMLTIFLLVVILTLNLLPHKWSKYTALGIVVIPILFIYIGPKASKMNRILRNMKEEARPIFKDPERDQIARAIRNGEIEKLRVLLPNASINLAEDSEMLEYAINEAASTSYGPAEKLECVRLMFQAGAKWQNTLQPDEVPPHMAVADVGNAALLRLLLEQGADANAVQIHFKRPILFEAVGSYQEPAETVRALLEYGANPNSTAIYDHETGPVPPIWVAAILGRWNLCVLLLEHGADPNFVSSKGQTFRELVAESERDFPQTGYTTQADYDHLRQLLK